MSRRDQDPSASATASDSANLSLDANQSQTIARRRTLPPEMFGVTYASSFVGLPRIALPLKHWNATQNCAANCDHRMAQD